MSCYEAMSQLNGKGVQGYANSKGITAQKILEINPNHKIYEKIKKLYEEDKEELKDISQILLTQAMLIEGLPIENPAEYSDMVCKRL